MKRLLFILSCLMFVSLSYASTVYGKLEKLEGNRATVRVYKDNGTPQVETLNLKSTEDKYLHQPLRAEGQGVFIYGTDALSQVDKDAVENIMSRFKYVWTGVCSLFVVIVLISIIIRPRPVVEKAQSALGILTMYLTTIFSLFKELDPQREIVDYGRVTKLKTGKYMIEDENGNKQVYDVSGVFCAYYHADGNWSDPTTEGGIIESDNGYELYQSIGNDRQVVEATMQYINEKAAFRKQVLKYITFIVWGCTFILHILPLLSKRIRRLKQTKYRCLGETLVIKFWDDFKENPEEKKFLLERLKASLQNSGYKRWKEDFYDVVAKRARESIRPSKEQRQQSDANKSTEDLGGIRLNFNGIFVTSQQYQILSKNAKAWTLSPDDLIILCRKLAETMPEFRDFLDGKIIRTPQSLMDNNEAYALFGLTFETLTEASLKQAYRYLIQLYHPDKNQNAKAKEMFQKVQSYHAYLEAELRRKAA